jgi:hypothetical protein
MCPTAARPSLTAASSKGYVAWNATLRTVDQVPM